MKTKNTTRKGRILGVELRQQVDTSPNFSYIGKYSSTPGATGCTIDREARGDCGRDEFRYFIACNDHTNPASWTHVDNAAVSAAWLRLPLAVRMTTPGETRAEKIAAVGASYVEADYLRAESLNRGVWCYLGIYAKARVTLPGSDVVQTIRSGGLWGIESDNGAEYLAEVKAEQTAELRAELEAVGFSPRAIALAFRNIDTREG